MYTASNSTADFWGLLSADFYSNDFSENALAYELYQ